MNKPAIKSISSAEQVQLIEVAEISQGISKGGRDGHPDLVYVPYLRVANDLMAILIFQI